MCLFSLLQGEPGIMGPFGMPGASIPGPPGPKVAFPGNLYLSSLWIYGSCRNMHECIFRDIGVYQDIGELQFLFWKHPKK